MWAVPRADGYEIDNVPFYVMNLACGDVVEATPDVDGFLEYSRLVSASGHSTVQILVGAGHDIGIIREDLVSLGCSSEVTGRLIAVDIPPGVPYANVKAYLDRGEGAGRFEYQEACLGFM